MEYYVYVYLRERNSTPYYIGKGKGRRAFCKNHNVSVPKNKQYIVFLKQDLTEFGALAFERWYIKWYGRKDLGTGCLYNKTDGGDNSNISSEMKQKLRIANKKQFADPVLRERHRKGCERNNFGHKGKLWINNGVVNKRVNDREYKMIYNDWNKGRLLGETKFYTHGNRKRDATTGRYLKG